MRYEKIKSVFKMIIVLSVITVSGGHLNIRLELTHD